MPKGSGCLREVTEVMGVNGEREEKKEDAGIYVFLLGRESSGLYCFTQEACEEGNAARKKKSH